MCSTLDRLNTTRMALQIDGSTLLAAIDDDRDMAEEALRQPRREARCQHNRVGVTPNGQNIAD